MEFQPESLRAKLIHSFFNTTSGFSIISIDAKSDPDQNRERFSRQKSATLENVELKQER
ncbi:MAG: hypothetical protein RM368_34205 [Nostoc sp. DedSLP03]|uniref:hypothetical protein n=1 Tax=Nostoc sp. DedSLP03 TaxID=3075400 RepID=UPI002AD28F46|nr:hypothetical protein [Nostoc sp. DedSLP03]MDZ7969937.1 hypothetical protein [Nostoc sp. DedSLP03]